VAFKPLFSPSFRPQPHPRRIAIGELDARPFQDSADRCQRLRGELKLASQIENSEALVNKWGGQSRLTQLIQQQRSGQSACLRANDELGKLALVV
jgi:hypothetical protein